MEESMPKPKTRGEMKQVDHKEAAARAFHPNGTHYHRIGNPYQGLSDQPCHDRQGQLPHGTRLRGALQGARCDFMPQEKDCFQPAEAFSRNDLRTFLKLENLY